jgi:hypothetical protein
MWARHDFFVRRAMAAEIGAASSSQGARQMKRNRERPNIFFIRRRQIGSTPAMQRCSDAR